MCIRLNLCSCDTSEAHKQMSEATDGVCSVRSADAQFTSEAELHVYTHVQNPIAYDTVEALNEIFKPIDSIFQDRLADAESTSEAAKFFYDKYFSRLFALYKEHKDGLIKARDFREARLGILKSTDAKCSHR